MSEVDINEITKKVQGHSNMVQNILKGLSQSIVGQKDMLEKLLIGLLSDGHILLEGVPGLAKTTAIKALAFAIDAQFKRIQFTPDLLPADLIGTQVFNPKSGEFNVKKGPVFANIILADEINRAPSKVQSALLEAMQEKQVTIGGETYKLSDLFLVLASQNPIEQEGTYPLPEAQVDRFMLKVIISYPTKDEERVIVDRVTNEGLTFSHKNATAEEILAAREAIKQIYIDNKLKDYIVNIVNATRDPLGAGIKEIAEFIEYGASPRASIYLAAAAKTHAFLKGRGYVTPEDVKSIGLDVLRHRIILSYEAEAEEIQAENIVQKIFDGVEVP
jgi:MoxR-like ATPase